MASLSLKNVTKVYPNGFVGVKDFSLEIADKEFIIFVGPSGCGTLYAVMQPHTFDRVKHLFNDYLTCTAAADVTVVMG